MKRFPFLCLDTFFYSYSIFIRPAEGMCCVEYTVCADDNAFSLNTGRKNTVEATVIAVNAAKEEVVKFDFAGVDNSCLNDYIRITGTGFLTNFYSCVIRFSF